MGKRLIGSLELDRIYQMDCIEGMRLLPDESIDLIIADPPYNIEIAGQAWDKVANFTEWMDALIDEWLRLLKPTGNLFIYGGFPIKKYTYEGDIADVYLSLRRRNVMREVLIWHYKTGNAAKHFYPSRFEVLLWAVKSEDYKFNIDDIRIKYDEKTLAQYKKDKRLNHETLEKGKIPDNVWIINRINGSSKEKTGHPSQKPLEICERIVKGHSDKGDIILVPFAGSGSECVAAIRNGRHFIGFERESEYIEIANKRLENVWDELKSV
jgi:site-specific DNA-methyltransferase (adenine-specific)